MVASMDTTYRTLQTPEERLLYTVAAAGEMLGISRAFAYELVARGELPVICLGRRRLVPKVALLALVGMGTEGDSPAVSAKECEPVLSIGKMVAGSQEFPVPRAEGGLK